MSKKSAPEPDFVDLPLISDPVKIQEIRNTLNVSEIFRTRAKASRRNREKYNGCLQLFGIDVYDPASNGAKQFFLTSYKKFWICFKRTGLEYRCYYEIFMEERPCHLYADLEFSKDTNKGIDGDELCAEIETYVKQSMIELGYVERESDVRTIALDASSASKFSRHYIFKMEEKGIDGETHNKVFVNNYHCGAFFRRIQNRIVKDHGKIDDLNNKFFLWGEDEKDFVYKPVEKNRQFIIDMGVYTKNRQFRLPWNTKYLKNRYFQFLEKPIELGKLTGKFMDTLLDQFMDAMATYVDLVNDSKVFCLELDGSQPTSTSNKRIFREDPDEIDTFMPVSSSSKRKRDPTTIIPRGNKEISHPVFDEIARFICEIWNSTNGVWFKEYNTEYMTATFETRSRDCHYKGSQHKGNNIYFVADFKRLRFRQKCLDETDCQPYFRMPPDRLDKLPQQIRERVTKELRGYDFPDSIKAQIQDFMTKNKRPSEECDEICDAFFTMMESF